MINEKDPKRRGRGSRNKGKRSELELAAILRDVYGYDVRRGHVFEHEPDLVGLAGIHAEVKRVERLNLSAAMQQAAADSEKRKDGLPAVFHRKDREDWLVTMRLEDWADLYGGWINDE